MTSLSNYPAHYQHSFPVQEHTTLAPHDHPTHENDIQEEEMAHDGNSFSSLRSSAVSLSQFPDPSHPKLVTAPSSSASFSQHTSTLIGMNPSTLARLRLKPSISSLESDSSFTSAQSFHTVAGSTSSMVLHQDGERTPTRESYGRSSIYHHGQENDDGASSRTPEDQKEENICNHILDINDLDVALPLDGYHSVSRGFNKPEQLAQQHQTEAGANFSTSEETQNNHVHHLKELTETLSRIDLVDTIESVNHSDAAIRESPEPPMHDGLSDKAAIQNDDAIPVDHNHGHHRQLTTGISDTQSNQQYSKNQRQQVRASPSIAGVKNTSVRPRSRRLSAPERMSVASVLSIAATSPTTSNFITSAPTTTETTSTGDDQHIYHTSLASTSSADNTTTSSSDLTSQRTTTTAFSQYHRRRESSVTTTDSEMDYMDELRRKKEPMQASAQHFQSMFPAIGVPPSIIPSSMDLHHQPSSYPLHHDYRQGVVFEYYEGEWDWLPNFDEMRPANVGLVGNFLIEDTTETEIFRPKFRTKPSGPPGNFAVRFTTNIDIRQDGVYTFWLSSNDGSTLYIANQLVVENDGTHYVTEAEGRIMLTAGKHSMIVEFFHRNGKMLEGFRSTGPSLEVHYRPPGPIWSFGLTLGPKQVIKSMNLFYDHGDLRMVNLLSKYSQDLYLDPLAAAVTDDTSITRLSHDGSSSCYSPKIRPNRQWIMSGDMMPMQPSTREMFVQMENAKATIKDLEQIIRDQAQSHQKRIDELYAILQETMAQKNRLVQGLKQAQIFNRPWMSTNATTTVPVNSQSRQQSSGLAGMNGGVGDTPTGSTSVTGASAREAASSSRCQTHSSWRNTVASVYVDAQEGYSDDDEAEPNDIDNEVKQDDDFERLDNEVDSDMLLERHLSEVERLKQLYFFSMALSVKMNTQMKLNSQQQVIQASQESELIAASTPSADASRNAQQDVNNRQGASGSFSSFLSRTFTTSPRSSKDSSTPTTMSLQKLYEDCCNLKIPVENWPAYVSRSLGISSFNGGSQAPLSLTATNMPTAAAAKASGHPLYSNGRGGIGSTAARSAGGAGGRVNPGAAIAANTTMPVFVIL